LHGLLKLIKILDRNLSSTVASHQEQFEKYVIEKWEKLLIISCSNQLQEVSHLRKTSQYG